MHELDKRAAAWVASRMAPAAALLTQFVEAWKWARGWPYALLGIVVMELPRIARFQAGDAMVLQWAGLLLVSVALLVWLK